MKIVSPEGRIAGASGALAPRPETLDGRRVALLDNQKENAAAVLRAIADELRRRGGLSELVFLSKNFPAEPARNLDEIAAACDVLINGVGH